MRIIGIYYNRDGAIRDDTGIGSMVWQLLLRRTRAIRSSRGNSPLTALQHYGLPYIRDEMRARKQPPEEG